MMRISNRVLGKQQAIAVVVFMLIAGMAGAETRDAASGYVGDIEGSVLRSGTGECIRTGDWTPDKATVVGCDDVTLDAPVEIVVGQPTGIVEGFVIPAASLFAFDSAEVTPEGKNALEEYRAQFAPAITDAAAAVIIGHTDSTGDEKYNHELSLRRAEAVHEYLVATGTPAEKLRFIGRGENDPIAPNDTPEGQALNRRVEVIVVAELRGFDAMRFPSVALFPRRSAELTPEGTKVLEKHRNDARDMLQRAVYIEVVGHTDDVGDDAYNQDLSEQRANTVRDYLVATGADGSKILAIGAGERLPIASNNTPEGRAENRRVEVFVLGRLKSQ